VIGFSLPRLCKPLITFCYVVSDDFSDFADQFEPTNGSPQPIDDDEIEERLDDAKYETPRFFLGARKWGNGSATRGCFVYAPRDQGNASARYLSGCGRLQSAGDLAGANSDMTRDALDVLLRAVPDAADRAAFARVLEQVGHLYPHAELTVNYPHGRVRDVTLLLKARIAEDDTLARSLARRRR